MSITQDQLYCMKVWLKMGELLLQIIYASKIVLLIIFLLLLHLHWWERYLHANLLIDFKQLLIIITNDDWINSIHIKMNSSYYWHGNPIFSSIGHIKSDQIFFFLSQGINKYINSNAEKPKEKDTGEV